MWLLSEELFVTAHEKYSLYVWFFFSFRADKLYDMLKEQAELLKELNQLTRVEGVSSRDGKNGEEKDKKSGLFGF